MAMWQGSKAGEQRRQRRECTTEVNGWEGGQAMEKFTSTLGWSRKSCNLAAAKEQKQMSHVSFHLIPAIHLPLLYSPHEFIFFPASSFCSLLSSHTHNVKYHLLFFFFPLTLTLMSDPAWHMLSSPGGLIPHCQAGETVMSQWIENQCSASGCMRWTGKKSGRKARVDANIRYTFRI